MVYAHAVQRIHQSNGKRTVSSCFNFHSKDRSIAACCFRDNDIHRSFDLYIYILDRGKKIFLNENGKIYRYQNWPMILPGYNGRARIVSLNSRILFATVDSFTRYLCK